MTWLFLWQFENKSGGMSSFSHSNVSTLRPKLLLNLAKILATKWKKESRAEKHGWCYLSKVLTTSPLSPCDGLPLKKYKQKLINLMLVEMKIRANATLPCLLNLRTNLIFFSVYFLLNCLLSAVQDVIYHNNLLFLFTILKRKHWAIFFRFLLKISRDDSSLANICLNN